MKENIVPQPETTKRISNVLLKVAQRIGFGQRPLLTESNQSVENAGRTPRIKSEIHTGALNDVQKYFKTGKI